MASQDELSSYHFLQVVDALQVDIKRTYEPVCFSIEELEFSVESQSPKEALSHNGISIEIVCKVL